MHRTGSSCGRFRSTMPAYAATSVNHLEDLSAFEATAADTLALVNKGAYTRLRPSPDTWGMIDDAADAAIAALGG